jgi:hypothetical protein
MPNFRGSHGQNTVAENNQTSLRLIKKAEANAELNTI